MKSKDKIALFDLDDTLIDLKEALWMALKLEYGDKVPHWSLWHSHNANDIIGISLEELKEVCIKHEVFKIIKPNLFAPYLLKDLKDLGYHIVILTARGGFVPDPETETIAYLEKHDMLYDDLIITHHGENKSEALDGYDKIDFAIDDQEQNCIDLAESGKVEQVFLAALPHNRNCSRFIRLHNLYQVYSYIDLDKY